MKAKEYTNEKICQLQFLSSEVLWNYFPSTSIFTKADYFKQPLELFRGICKMLYPRQSKAGDFCFSNPMINKELWLKIHLYIYINIGIMLNSCHVVESHTWLRVWEDFQSILQSLFIFPDLPENQVLSGAFMYRGAAFYRDGLSGEGWKLLRCWYGSGCWHPWPW